jgi:flagellin
MSIAFNGAVSANLAVLKSTNEAFQVSQKRVATGKMIFSAADDAARYRMSETMLGRARQIDDVNNNIGLALKTLTSIDNALKNISDLVTSAQAIARKAQSEGADGIRGVVSTANIAATTTVAGTAANDTFSITSDSGQSFNYTFQNATTTWGTVVDALNAANIGVQAEFIPSATAGQTNIRFKSTNGKDFTFNATSDEGLTSPTGQTFNAVNLFRNGTTAPTATETGFTIGFGGSVIGSKTGVTTGTAVAANSTLVFTDGNNQVRTITYTAASTLNQVMTDINGLNAGVKAELVNQAGTNVLRLRNTNGGNITIQAGTGDFLSTGTLGMVTAGGTATGYAASLSSNNALRLTYGQQYDSIINNINQIVANVPVTTGRNLLAGNNMAVVMDEFGGNSLTITGINISGAGNTNNALGFTAALGGNTWTTDAAIQASATAANNALNSLRTSQATFSTFNSYMKDRYDINASSKSELTTLGNELVAADVAEESANLTALQTQQQFAVQAFSMGSQTQQALLRLLG